MEAETIIVRSKENVEHLLQKKKGAIISAYLGALLPTVLPIIIFLYNTSQGNKTESYLTGSTLMIFFICLTLSCIFLVLANKSAKKANADYAREIQQANLENITVSNFRICGAVTEGEFMYHYSDIKKSFVQRTAEESDTLIIRLKDGKELCFRYIKNANEIASAIMAYINPPGNREPTSSATVEESVSKIEAANTCNTETQDMENTDCLYTVVVNSGGGIGAIKAIRSINGSSLVEAQLFLGGLPRIIVENVTQKEAQRIAILLHSGGLDATIR